MKTTQRLAITLLVGILLSQAAYAGTITGSRTSSVGTITGSSAGTITGSSAGTITGSSAGTITGSKAGTITGSRNIYATPAFAGDIFSRVLRLFINFGW